MDWDDLSRHDSAMGGPERVLVAIVPRTEDWDRVVAHGWYRIPLAHAPERVGAEYLAFYHPSRFGEMGCSIRYYAPIERYRLATRRELLPEEPDHPRAEERYLKLELGPLHSLPRPIPAAKLRRVTFISTTLDRLLAAREINDLWLRETAKDGLWQALRERGIEAYRDHLLLHEDGHCVADVAVPAGQGGLAIDCGGDTLAEATLAYAPEDVGRMVWSWLYLSRAQIMCETEACVAKVQRALRALS